MTHVEVGFYISNATLGALACTFVAAFSANPNLVTAGVMFVAKLISGVVDGVLTWIGAVVGGPVGGLIGYIVGAFSGWTITTNFAKATVSGKGLRLSWSGISVE